MKKTPPKPNGGRREGSGRKPDWLKERCRELIDSNKLLDYAARVAAGKEYEDRVTKDGESYKVGVSTHDRLHAFEILMDRGFGKPIQALEHTGSVATSWEIVYKGFNAGE